jgi:hypothetical protein
VALLAGFTATTAIRLGSFAIFHLALTLTFAALVLDHLLLRLVLLARFAHVTILAPPAFPAPIISRQLISRSLDAARPGAIGSLTGWGGLLDGHIGIAKAHHLRLAVLAGTYNRLLAALDVPARDITWQIAWVHLTFLYLTMME